MSLLHQCITVKHKKKENAFIKLVLLMCVCGFVCVCLQKIHVKNSLFVSVNLHSNIAFISKFFLIAFYSVHKFDFIALFSLSIAHFISINININMAHLISVLNSFSVQIRMHSFDTPCIYKTSLVHELEIIVIVIIVMSFYTVSAHITFTQIQTNILHHFFLACNTVVSGKSSIWNEKQQQRPLNGRHCFNKWLLDSIQHKD